jgi:hypothetical protein
MKSMLPLNYFDRQLLLQAQDRWLKAARIIGSVMLKHDGHPFAHVRVLTRRLQLLVASGKLQSQGDLSRIGYSEVRLPPKSGRDARAPAPSLTQ